MNSENDVAKYAADTPSDAFLTTPEVAKLLGISRQAINRRVQKRSMLGFAGAGVTLFPRWQFDESTQDVHPVVADLLHALGPEVSMQGVARWTISRPEAGGPTVGDLLLSPETREPILTRAAAWASEPAPDPAAEAREIAAWTPAREGSSNAQEAILRAAADLFARKGPAKVSLREIAAAADVSYGLIYRFYRTKENLLSAVMDLLVTYGGSRLSSEQDAYAAIENSFGADIDAGQFGRMLTWSVLEEAAPEKLLGGARSAGYSSQVEALWADPVAPDVRTEFDPRTLASVIALVGSVWDQYEPYVTALVGDPERNKDDLRSEVTDLLKLLVYASRPSR